MHNTVYAAKLVFSPTVTWLTEPTVKNITPRKGTETIRK
jgi:Flp pilus assembly protein TadG